MDGDPNPDDLSGLVLQQTTGHWLLFDRSSTLTIVNDLPTTSLSLKGHKCELGTLMNAPESVIQPGGATTIRLRDSTGPFGSKGWVCYAIGGDGAEVMITFECPSVANNNVVAVPSDRATVGSYDPNGSLQAEVRIH